MREKENLAYGSVLSDIKRFIHAGRNSAYNAASSAMILTYWNIGKRIVEQEQCGLERAEYGKGLIAMLAQELTLEFGSGFSERNLRNCRKFYLYFPDKEIWNACVPNLN